MKNIYITLSRSDTMVSKMISVFSEGQYTHASISFNNNLSPMYSFARKGYMPLPGGLKLEYADEGYYKLHGHTPCAVYALEVEDKVYYTAKALVGSMMDELDKYNYNVIGLILCKLNIPWARRHHYFCSQFVSEILARSHALELPKHTSLMQPNDYVCIPELTLCFEGHMSELAMTKFKGQKSEKTVKSRADCLRG